ncbi:MAG: TdeIII family type II restriction endonuclease [Dehalococcoidales bacterium]|nr:TdeIII family type II restriction endonuclease [Dehalococcoidales bacterium]
MSLLIETKTEIARLLETTVLGKLKTYHPETQHMPFHHRLLGKDKYAMFSFIQSMNTTFGISIWEQIAAILANSAGNSAERQYRLLGEVDEGTEKLISDIYYNLRKATTATGKMDEIERIRREIRHGQPKVDPDSVVDLLIKTNDTENYFDITTAKPNMKDFVALKLKLLRWTALRLSQDKNVQVFTRLAIPYNPYHPEPYERWTLRGLYDLDNGEILVGDEFWNFVANDNIYDELLDIFQEVGNQLRSEVDKKFEEFRRI